MPNSDIEERRACGRRWYAKNKQVYLDKNVRRRATARAFIAEYLSTHPCVDCGEADLVVLDFDHVEGEKFMEVTVMVRNGYSLARIEEEIAKCEVVCANDHRRRTAARRSS